MENDITTRRAHIGHGKDWVTTKSESELSNQALQNDAYHVSVGYDTGMKVGRGTGLMIGCTLGILVGTIVTRIVLKKLKNDSEQ